MGVSAVYQNIGVRPFKRVSSFWSFGDVTSTDIRRLDDRSRSPAQTLSTTRSQCLCEFTLLPAIQNITSKPIILKRSYELDYIILSHDELNVFGHGATLEEAKLMLMEDLLTLKEDVIEGLVHESNASPDRLRMLKELFEV